MTLSWITTHSAFNFLPIVYILTSCLIFLFSLLPHTLDPKESHLSKPWPFPFLLGHDMNSLSGSTAPAPTFGPCRLREALLCTLLPYCPLLKRKPADSWPYPPTNTELAVSSACEAIGKKPVNGYTVGLLHPHQQCNVYL